MELLNKDAFLERPRCVLLDLDDTLYEYAPAHAAGMAAVQAYVTGELAVAQADFDGAYAVSREELKRRLGRTASSHSRLLYFQRTIERLGLASQPAVALQMEQTYWSAFLGAAELFDNVKDFLDDLRIAGIPAAIVTDLTAQIQHRKLIFFGLHRLVEWVTTSEEVRHDKPSPAIFELALAKMGGVEGVIWMVGDNPHCDVKGARDAIGAKTLQKLHGDKSVSDAADEKPDATFRDFDSLRKLLARLPG